MKKRQFIKVGLSFSAAFLAGSNLMFPISGKFARAETRSAKREMPVPRLVEPIGDVPFELTIGRGEWEILNGIRTPTIGFSGPYLGPTIRLREGQSIPLTYRNNLSEPVAIHGHGLHVPGEVDGGPQREIEPGESWTLELRVRQEACTSWYHPHTHGKTGPQTYNGLAGLIVIEDENSGSLQLPNTYGVDDIPVIVQDRSIDSLGRLVYSVEDAEDGLLAETITVNGIANPIKTVPAGLVRLRVLNGSNARYYRFCFSDNRVFHKIATDGGFLEEPVPIREMVMLPGERNEIVVDFSDGRSAILASGPGSRSSINTERRERSNRNRRDDWEPGGLNDTFDILEFRVDSTLPSFQSPLPCQLNVIDRPSVGKDWPARRFEMFMRDDNERRRFFGGRSRSSEMAMGINGKSMDMNVINERVKLGQWERWEVRSNDGSHPFHVHGCSFLVLSQDGQSVLARILHD